MKIKWKIIAIPAILFFISLTSDTIAQMGGGGMMGRGSGMGQGSGGQGYGPRFDPRSEQNQPSPNLTPDQQKARAKTFVDDYIKRYLPDYRLEKNDDRKSK